MSNRDRRGVFLALFTGIILSPICLLLGIRFREQLLEWVIISILLNVVGIFVGYKSLFLFKKAECAILVSRGKILARLGYCTNYGGLFFTILMLFFYGLRYYAIRYQ